jgi:hypothetical protein
MTMDWTATILGATGTELLFDLEHDEGEAADLAGVRPADVARMRAQHDAWFARATG